MSARHTSSLEMLLLDEAFEGDVMISEPLARHTTYQIGGPARFFVQVDTLHALITLLKQCEAEDMPWFLLGRGSNLLVSDTGFPGVVIVLGRAFRVCRYDEEMGYICTGAGASLSSVVQKAYRYSLAGLEFAVGTPGSIGGALRMNAGTSQVWLGKLVHTVTSLTAQGVLQKRSGADIAWGYRYSSLPSDEVLVECELKVEPFDPNYIRGKMEAQLTRRRKTQPLAEASCGSVFKNPAGASAADLIEQAGLKGTHIGGACVSDMHANFIINTGSASASDVRSLIELIQSKVYEVYGIELQPEVRFLGFA